MADGNNLPASQGSGNLKENNKKKGGEDLNDDEDSGALSIILVTLFIILIWLAILGLLVKLDVGGFGSGVLTPVLKDVPVVNRILPGYNPNLEGNGFATGDEIDGGYTDVDSAVSRIKELENQLTEAQQANNELRVSNDELQEEIDRLRTFENNQVEFEKIKDEFYNEVVFSDKAPDISEYQKYYEQIEPANAQILYKQVVAEEQTDEKMQEYAKAYSAMKAKDAAKIFDVMVQSTGADGDAYLVARILKACGSDARGEILGAMQEENAAIVTNIMEPEAVIDTSGSSSGPTPVPEEYTGTDNGAQNDDDEEEED
ncbi:MAG: hypothetical protein K5668_09700 [Lachnospiraceae bacterium]|nr:hypothetical protein [Lachnospiraceae bacterium]